MAALATSQIDLPPIFGANGEFRTSPLLYGSKIDLPPLLSADGEFRTSPRFNTDAFEISSGTGPSITFYYFMEAYDAAALVWKTWIATGAPDVTASQYPGPAFPFTVVSVLRTWSA